MAETGTPLADARLALRRLNELTAAASRSAAAGRMMLPQQEAAMRSQQDGLMAMAQAAALVSIAESLAEIAELLRPDIRLAEQGEVSGG